MLWFSKGNPVGRSNRRRLSIATPSGGDQYHGGGGEGEGENCLAFCSLLHLWELGEDCVTPHHRCRCGQRTMEAPECRLPDVILLKSCSFIIPLLRP
ncbi:hypothetical protein TcWFU_008453 [Taenia crassiceps]|uniref:Uncharacterized protein n=1 Tax=Taenia crassiceps TaxID=6207 RepID=A0ABR4Q8C6_9CEST